MMNTKHNKFLKKAQMAEIQAISIYEAEIFWIKNKHKNSILKKILEEEKDHESELKNYHKISHSSLLFGKVSGWMLGTLLSLLPWKIFCSVQCLAEIEASKVYKKTYKELSMLITTKEKTYDSLLEILKKAKRQEIKHAQIFKRKKFKLSA